MRRFLAAFIAAASFAPAATVPDESVLPQWTKSFEQILRLSKANFVQPQLGTSGPAASEIFLDSADECTLAGGSSQAGRRTFSCYFWLKGRSAAEAQDDYNRLIRLVEEATRFRATNPPHVEIQPQYESRSIRLRGPTDDAITVSENVYRSVTLHSSLCVVVAARPSVTPGAPVADATPRITKAHASSRVPEESVLPQWTRTFDEILPSAKSNFARVTPRTTGEGASDTELRSGLPRSPDPQLEGAEHCGITVDDNNPSKRRVFSCGFSLDGRSSAEAEDDYVHLVRLAENATHSAVAQIAGRPNIYVHVDAEKHVEHRSATLPNGILVLENYNEDDHLNASWLWVTLGGAVAAQADSAGDADILGNIARMPPVGGLRSEISQVAQGGNYTPLPVSARCMPYSGTGTLRTIENGTSYELRVMFTGAADREATIPPGHKQSINLPAGAYKVLGRVGVSNVLPFYGEESYKAGEECAVQFYIQ